MDASLRLLSGVPETLILTLCAGFLDGVFGEHDSEPFKEKRDRAVRGSISLPPARTGPPRRRPRSQHTPTRFGPSRRSINTCALNEQTGGPKGRLSVTERGGGGRLSTLLPSCSFHVSFPSPLLQAALAGKRAVASALQRSHDASAKGPLATQRLQGEPADTGRGFSPLPTGRGSCCGVIVLGRPPLSPALP